MKNIASIQHAVISKQYQCETVVTQFLNRIEEFMHLNAFLDVYQTDALERAKEIDLKIQNGTAGKLAGVVIAIKSNMCLQGKRVNASSKILDNFNSIYTASAIENLLAEDVIIIGSTNCDEMAMGASNENSAYGPVLNYLDNTLVPGGSSGGSAVAVQAGMCHAALGSDTGGSIRQPASFTGTTGYKPSYGSISRYGLLAYASSFDQIGPIANCVADCAVLTQIMSGPDNMDATANEAKMELSLTTISTPLKFTFIKEAMDLPGLNPEVKLAFENTIAKLKENGHQVSEVSFPYLDFVVPTYYVLTTAEASSNLSRYSGLMYGYRSPNATNLETTFIKSRSEGFGLEVKRRILLGTFVLSSNHYDAYYKKAQQLRRLIKDWTDTVFKSCDILLSPTSATPAFKIGEKANDPIALYLADLLTVHANIAGNGAISIPMGYTKTGLPIGLQLCAAVNQDKNLLSIANYIESLN